MSLWPKSVYNWGTSEAERARQYPCDLILADPDQEMYRAVDVDAPASKLFLWLCQLRLAPYSYDWIDNFGRQSPRRLVPGLDQLEAGQEFMRIFVLDSFEPGRSLTLRTKQPGLSLAAVTYLTESLPSQGSRLLVKFSVRYSSGAAAMPMRLVLPPGDLVMMRRQLLNLKRLAEGESAVSSERS